MKSAVSHDAIQNLKAVEWKTSDRPSFSKAAAITITTSIPSPPDGIHSFSLFPYWMMTNDTVFLRPTHYISHNFLSLSLFIIWFWFCLVVIDIFDGKLRKESKIRTALTWLATWLPKSARPRKRVTDMTHEACVDVGIHTQTHTHTRYAVWWMAAWWCRRAFLLIGELKMERGGGVREGEVD